MNPDRGMAERMRAVIEADGDRLTDLHLWRLGPGHLGAIVSVATARRAAPDYYQSLLNVSHPVHGSVAGLVGALVIAAWSYGLMRDTGAILLDMISDRGMAERVRATIERDGDRLEDLHLWRLGPGHLGAILSVVTAKPRDADHYRRLLGHFRNSVACHRRGTADLATPIALMVLR